MIEPRGHRVMAQSRGKGEDLVRPQDLVRVDELRSAASESPCLRPLGLCELGGCCDACWYSPDHPRFQDRQED